MAGVRERHELGHDLARELIEAHRHPRAAGARLLAREREHLLHEVNGSLYSRRQRAHGGLALGFPAGARQHAELQVQRRERGTQLVRRIRHEGALALEC